MRYLLLILALALTGCPAHQLEEHQHKYRNGDRVTLKVDGTQAMVIGVAPFSDEVRIRLPGGCGESVVVREFELAPEH